jgi:hypothetical protein
MLNIGVLKHVVRAENIQQLSGLEQCYPWRARMLIPDPIFFIPDPGPMVKKIPDPGSASKTFFLSSQKYDSGCSSRIRIPDPDLDLLPIRDPESPCGQKGTGSRILIRNTVQYNQAATYYYPRINLLFSETWYDRGGRGCLRREWKLRH